jgi:hypothetical protein
MSDEKIRRLHDMWLEAMEKRDFLMANNIGISIGERRAVRMLQLTSERQAEWGGRVPPHP